MAARDDVIVRAGADEAMLGLRDAQLFVDALMTAAREDSCKDAVMQALLKAEGGPLDLSDAQQLVDAVTRGAVAGMAVALMMATAIAQAQAGETAAAVSVPPDAAAIAAEALSRSTARSTPALRRLRVLLGASRPKENHLRR
jgi:hypothetical protein